MDKYFRPKSGNDAIKALKKVIHLKRIHNQLDMTQKMEKQIDERIVKVFTKKGKVPFKIKEREFEKEILNPLRLGQHDRFSSADVDVVDKGLGFTDHTKQIGTKYKRILQHEKEAERQKHFEELKSPKEAVSDAPETKRSSDEPSRYDIVRERIAMEALKKKEAMSRFSGKDNELGGVSQDKYAKKDKELGGVRFKGEPISDTGHGHGEIHNRGGGPAHGIETVKPHISEFLK